MYRYMWVYNCRLECLTVAIVYTGLLSLAENLCVWGSLVQGWFMASSFGLQHLFDTPLFFLLTTLLLCMHADL